MEGTRRTLSSQSPRTTKPSSPSQYSLSSSAKIPHALVCALDISERRNLFTVLLSSASDLGKKGKGKKKKRVSLTCVEICYWKLEEDFNHFLLVLGESEGLICLGFSYRLKSKVVEMVAVNILKGVG